MEHKHAAILRAIADGKEIQWCSAAARPGTWIPCSDDTFFYYRSTAGYQFRVKPERISAWLNIYHRKAWIYATKEAADDASRVDRQYGEGRIACIPVEFNEGDGL
jgi:hypothetical protein